MRINLEPDHKTVDFDTYTQEIGPHNEVEHLLSLLSLRYTNLDPTTLELCLNNNPIKENLTIYQAGIQDGDTLVVRSRKSFCCNLL